MNRIRLLLAIALLAPLALAEEPAGEMDKNRGIGPYFAVDSKDGVDGFPLLKTEAKTSIAGVIANVRLTQVYKNSGDKTIEAVYVFPLGTRAAIHAMRMRIGDRTIEAEIHEREVAKQIYEAAKQDGKVTSLLEQQRPNVFTMNVANIMPGDVVNVAVDYTELLVPEEGTYEYVFPAVVGPRFTGESDQEDLEGKDNWVATPYTKEGEDPSYAFNIEVALDTGIPITRLEVPTHGVNVEKSGDEARVTLAPEERKGGNKDFILRYSLQGESIQSGLVLYPGEEENFFLLMMEPPEVVKPAMIPPREYLFIVDVSGSMNGFPLDTAKTLIKRMLSGLRETDFFNILFFAGGSNVLSDQPLPATAEHVKRAMDMLEKQRGGGGTQILNALQTASKLEKREGVSRTIIAVTDGYVSVEKEAFDAIRDGLGGANFFAFGIGSSVNRYLIEGMARAGNGKPFMVTGGAEADKTAAKFMSYVQTPLLTDIKVAFDGFDAYDVEPPSLPDLFTERPLILFGKYRKAEGGIAVTGNTPEGAFRREFGVKADLENAANDALKHLWARKRLQLLWDYAGVGQENREEVVAIGLKYHLMTAHTSFVAVDSVVRDTGEVVTVKQPLPLPEGVSNLAVGGYYAGRPARRLAFAANTKSMLMPAARPGPALDTGDALAEEEEPRDEDRPRKARGVRLMGATLPKGLSLRQAEDALIKQIGEKLADVFKEWELTRVVVKLDIEKGEVTKVSITDYKGKKMDEEVLETIFKKLKLDRGISGTARLTVVGG